LVPRLDARWPEDRGSFGASGLTNLWVQELEAGTAQRLTEDPERQLPTAISADGATVVFHSFPRDLKAVPLREPAKPRPLVNSASEERNGVLSPDGRWLAHEAESASRPGELDVYVRPFPDVDRAVWQVTRGGGTFPSWSRDGRELFYLKPDGTMVAVAVEAAATTWRAGRATELFRGRYLIRDGSLGRLYDVAADGRFLMLKEARDTSRSHFVVVQSWTAELNRIVR
jgi:hypothetical protein